MAYSYMHNRKVMSFSEHIRHITDDNLMLGINIDY